MNMEDDEFLKEMKDLTELKEWAINLESYFECITEDLDLKINHKVYIHIALDFFDLINHIYPEEHLFVTNDRIGVLKLEIAREALFDLCGSIYEQPIVLLPPYLSELNDFFYFSSNKLIDLESSIDTS